MPCGYQFANVMRVMTKIFQCATNETHFLKLKTTCIQAYATCNAGNNFNWNGHRVAL